jgi:hypothetical protein
MELELIEEYWGIKKEIQGYDFSNEIFSGTKVHQI